MIIMIVMKMEMMMITILIIKRKKRKKKKKSIEDSEIKTFITKAIGKMERNNDSSSDV